MTMSYIIGGVASSAVILASAFIYGTAPKAKAAVPEKEIVYVERVVERVVEKIVIVPARAPADPEAIFADASDEDRHCLAQNMYFESRGESQVGQEFVAWVTLNRVMDLDFPNDICSVVWQSSQFSWTADGKSDTPTDPVAWEQAQSIAEEVMLAYGVERDPTEGATYFHADWVTPDWANRFERIVQIDGHIFYTDSK